MEIEKEKKALIEMMGQFFENLYHLPPLGSRILAILIVELDQKITFEHLVSELGASKSSVSTNLNLLLKLGKIKYHTFQGDRKKYYTAAPFSERLTNYQRIIGFEKEIIDKLSAFREKTSLGATTESDLALILTYKQHLIDAEKLLDRTILKFREIEKNK